MRDLCGNLKFPATYAAMPKQLFPPDVAEPMNAGVRNMMSNTRDTFTMTLIGIFGGLSRRVCDVRRVSAAQWFSYDPDALVGPPEEPRGA